MKGSRNQCPRPRARSCLTRLTVPKVRDSPLLFLPLPNNFVNAENMEAIDSDTTETKRVSKPSRRKAVEAQVELPAPPKRGRGRPRKIPLPEPEEEIVSLSISKNDIYMSDTFLPGDCRDHGGYSHKSHKGHTKSKLFHSVLDYLLTSLAAEHKKEHTSRG